MLGDCRDHPGVRQLQQHGAAGGEEHRGFAVDAPDQQPGPKTPPGRPAAAARTTASPPSRSASPTDACGATPACS